MNRYKGRVKGMSLQGRAAGAGVLASLLAMSPVGIHAAEWSVVPSMNVGVGRDDNPSLRAAAEQEATSASVGAQVAVDGRTELSRLNVNAGAYVTKYSEESFDDAERQYANLRSSHRATERSRLELDGSFRRQNFYRYVIQDTGTVDLGDVDTGLVETEVRRETTLVNPSWSYALSETSGARIEYRARDVAFADAAGTNLVDYRQQDFWAGYTMRAGVRDDLNFLLGVGEYRADTGDSETETSRWRLGWTHGLTETAKGRIFVGQNFVTEKDAGQEREERGLAIEIGASERTELTTLDAVLSRDVQPSGIGVSVESTQFRLRYRRKLSQLSELFVRARVLRNEALEGASSFADRRYSELVPEFRWRLAPEWFVSASYRLRKRQIEGQDSAESNAIFVGITYASDRFREIQ